MRKTTWIAAALVMSAVSFNACKKDAKETQEVITSAEDNASVETEFTSAFDVADDFSSNDRRTRAGNTILPSGAVVNFTDSSYTDGDGVECTIDFGALGTNLPKGILCQDGRYRAGVLHLSSTKRYSMDSAVVVLSADPSDNYYAGDGTNMTQLSGSIAITRLTISSVNVKVSNAKAINSNGTITWQSDRTITKTVGNSTPGMLDDEFEVVGLASGTNRNGESFTVTIDKPLVKRVSLGCANTFIIGKLTLTNTSTGKVLKIDYDPYNNGNCDKIAKATVNNKEFIFTVR